MNTGTKQGVFLALASHCQRHGTIMKHTHSFRSHLGSHLTAWVIATPTCWDPLDSTSQVDQKRSAFNWNPLRGRVQIAKWHLAQTHGLPIIRAQEGGGKNEGEEKSDSGGEDWDVSWKQFVDKENGGGVFELPPERPGEELYDVTDKRVEKLTSAWSNESGFLLGIVGILFIAAFYVYVGATGGISR